MPFHWSLLSTTSICTRYIIFTETISAYSTHIYLLQCQNILQNRPSFPIVYTTSGTYIAASYSGQCKTCNTAYQPSYYEVQKEQYFYNLTNQKYLQISSQTAFELSYLDNVTNQLSICSSTLESIAELYIPSIIEHQTMNDYQNCCSFLEFSCQKCHGD